MMSKNTRGWTSWKTWPQVWCSSSWWSTSSSQLLESIEQITTTDHAHTHRHIYVCVYALFSVFHCSPLSFQTGIFSPALLCSLLLKTFMSSACFCSTPLLSGPSQSPTWPTNTVTSPGSQRNFHQKTTQTKYTAVHLPENHCPAWLQAQRENSEQERNSSSDKEVWYVNNTTFVLNGQTGKWRQQQSGPCDLMLSVSYAVRQWPEAQARHGCTVSHTHLNTL